MPDRAVVDDDLCPQRSNVHASAQHQWGVPQPGSNGLPVCLDCGSVKQPQLRAVVDDDDVFVRGEPISSRMVRARVTEVRQGVPLVNVDEFATESQPRAMVAISEDQMFAVLPGPKTTVALGWAILEKQPVSLGLLASSWSWAEVDYAEDTGQDAHEVLNAYLRERTP